MRLSFGNRAALYGRASARVILAALPGALVATGAFAGALPAGGTYVAGSGSIGHTARSVTVDQSSATGIIDWTGFSVGHANIVTIDNGSGATLNRVTGGNLSRIAGSLDATGTVYLIDPEGVIVNGTGKVVTGGSFIAGTQMPGSTDKQTGPVVDAGSITSGGNVRLSGTDVRISGSVAVTRGGHIWLMGSGTTTVSGSLDAQGGNRVAGKVIVRGRDIAMSGSIDASAGTASAEGGTVSIVAENTDTVSGTIKTTGNATGGVGAHGGSIETSGHVLSVDGADIDAGLGGRWLLDPYDLTVDGTAASTIDSALDAGTNVALRTTATGASGPGHRNKSGNGDIFIDTPIGWNTTAKLTLSAYRNIDFNAAVIASGGGSVSMTTGTGGSGDYSFGLGPAGFAGSLSFTGGASSGSVLAIDGTRYRLLYGMGAVQSIDNDLSGNFALATSLNAKSVTGWVPLGTAEGNISNSGVGFAGVFEGLGNKISNLSIDTSFDDVGLFGGSSGTIRDIGLVGGTITAENSVGDLIGVNKGTISDAYATGTVDGDIDVGGLAGLNFGILIIGSYATGAIDGSSANMGGLLGDNIAGTVAGCYATGAVTGADSSVGIGGLVGEIYAGVIDGSYATGTVSGGASTGQMGGLAGSNQGTIVNSFATSAVTGAAGTVTGSQDVGGLVGYNEGSVSESYATGSITGGTDVGGLAGLNYISVIDDSYAKGAVTGSVDVGGLVGSNSGCCGAGGAIDNSYAMGAVAGATDVGGLVGYANRPIADSYWDTATSGIDVHRGAGNKKNDPGITGLKTAQFRTGLPAGFDTSIWGESAKINGGLPYLLALPPS